MLVCARGHETRMHNLRAIVVTPAVALLAVEADIHDWLHTSTIANLPRLDIATELDDHACTFVAWRSHTEEACMFSD